MQWFCIVFIRKRLQTIATLPRIDEIGYVGHIDHIDSSIYDGAKFLMSLCNGHR
jgi:hypothetical protein